MLTLLVALSPTATAQSLTGTYDLACSDLALTVSSGLGVDSPFGATTVIDDVRDVPTSCAGTDAADLDAFETAVETDCLAAGVAVLDCAAIAASFRASIEDFDDRRDELIPASVDLTVGDQISSGVRELAGDHTYGDGSVISWDYELRRRSLTKLIFVTSDLYVPDPDVTDIESLGFTCTSETAGAGGSLAVRTDSRWAFDSFVSGSVTTACELSVPGSTVTLEITQDLALTLAGTP